MSEREQVPLPAPDLEPQSIERQYLKLIPDELEFWDGLLNPHSKSIIELLSVLLTKVGLKVAIRLAPIEKWEEAIRIVKQDASSS